MKKKSEILIALGIVILGIVVFSLFMKFRIKPKKIKVEYKGPIVNTMHCTTEERSIDIEVFGTVDSLKKINVIPQVSGKIVYVSPKFREGGFFKKGELMVSIEETDYKLALERAKANLFNAELNYKKALKQAKIAKNQWEEIYNNILKGEKVVPDELTLYIPQLKSAKANYDAAKAEVQLARLNLERTKIKAPFDSIVTSKNADISQVVSPQTVIASIYSVNDIEVIVPLTKKQVQLISTGNLAEIIPSSNGNRILKAKVDRLAGNYDLKTKMRNAYLTLLSQGQNRLKLYDFVICRIKSNKILCTKIPVNAFRDGKVWLYRDGKLKIEKAKLIYRGKEYAYLSGLPESFELITTNLYAVSDGMKVRRIRDKK